MSAEERALVTEGAASAVVAAPVVPPLREAEEEQEQAAEEQGAEVFDLIICLLHGVAHIHVTMSPYAWTDPARRVRLGITKILGAEPV